MIRLVIDTALHACSAALFDGERLIAGRHEIIGRGHAERLVPLVAELMAEAGADRADEVLVDVGPGSFTGIRVGVAAARAFGLAWGAPVRGFASTALVAAGVGGAVHVALDASRGEVYFQSFAEDGALGPVEALTPEAAARRAAGGRVAGSGAPLLAAVDAGLAIIDHPWPRASDAMALPEAARLLPPSPVYVRAPDARLPA